MKPLARSQDFPEACMCMLYTSESPRIYLALMFNPALIRDGHRCIVTDLFHENILRKDPEPWAGEIKEWVAGATVQTCHIVDESLMQGINLQGRNRCNG